MRSQESGVRSQRAGWGAGVARWGEATGLALIFAAGAMAWAAAAGRAAGTAGEWGAWGWAGAAGWAAVAGAWGWGLWRVWRRTEGGAGFAWAAAGSLFAVELGVAWACRGMSVWPMDSGVFRLFLERLAAGGYTPETLGELSRWYDYGAWCSRGLPALVPLMRWAGPERFGWWVGVYQSALGALTVVAAWRAGALAFGRKAAGWAVAALALMPGSWLQGVGLNHQVGGAFWFMAMAWLVAEWLWGGGGGWKRAGLAAAGCALAPALQFAGSAWGVYAMGAAAVLAWAWVKGVAGWRAAAAGLAALVLLPWAAGRAATGPMLARVRAGDVEKMNGGSLAYAARGWDPATGGEYSGTCERLDVLTPRAEKARFFRAYLAGRAAYAGGGTLGRLAAAKAAKFMLAGYAGLAEEVLRANGAERAAAAAAGARTAFFLLYAPLLLWGAWRMCGGAGGERGGYAVLPCALLMAAVVATGETSPRYLQLVQPLMAMVLGAGLAGAGGIAAGAWRRRLAGFGTAGALCAAAAVAVWAGRETWRGMALADLRDVPVEGARAAGADWERAFEVRLPDGEGAVTWPGEGSVAAYAWGAEGRGTGRAVVSCGAAGGREVELPARLELRWEAGEERRMEIRRTDGAGGGVVVGYGVAGGDG